jgi:hypothetical protein
MRLIVGLMVGFIPVIIFGKLLPILAPVALLIFLIALAWKVTRDKLRTRASARRWREFVEDRAWWVARSPNGEPDTRHDMNGKEIWVGSIRLDLKRNLIAFDVHRSAAPICVSIGSIRETRLLDLSKHPSARMLDCLLGLDVRLRGEKFPTSYYTNDARQILQMVDRIRSPNGESYTSVAT